MDEVLKNASLFMNILEMSKTSMVQQWDLGSFERALKWARYFEQVHAKLKNKEPLKQKLECHLRELRSKSISMMAHEAIHFEQLQKAQIILKMNILQNPMCSPEIYAEVLRCCYDVGRANSSSEELLKDLSDVLEAHRCCSMSGNIWKRLLKHKLVQDTKYNADDEAIGEKTEKLSGEYLSEKEVDEAFSIRVQSRLLWEKMVQCLEKQDKMSELVLKIDTLTSSTEGELILLEAYLANGRNSHYQGDSGDCSKKCQDFVFGYIKDKLVPAWRKKSERFLLLPAKKLVEVAASCDRFARIYMETVHFCCEAYDKEFGMEDTYLIINSSKTRTERRMERESWQEKLQSHFKEMHNQGILIRAKKVNFNKNENIDKVDCNVEEKILIECIWNRLISGFEF